MQKERKKDSKKKAHTHSANRFLARKTWLRRAKRVVFLFAFFLSFLLRPENRDRHTDANRKRQPIWLCEWQRLREKICLKKKNRLWTKQNMIVVHIEIKEKAVCRESKWFCCWKVSLLFILDLGACVRVPVCAVCVCVAQRKHQIVIFYRYCLYKALNFKWNMICSFELTQQVISWFNEYGLACVGVSTELISIV